MLSQFVRSRSGATSIEYGLIVVLLSLVVIGGISRVQDGVRALFEEPTSRLNQGLHHGDPEGD